MALTNRQVRVKVNLAKAFPDPLVDFHSGQPAESVRGNATRFEFGFFKTADVVASLTNVESLNLRLMASQTDDTILADKTILLADLDLTMTAETWLDETKEHAVFELDNAEMNLDTQGKRRTLWLVVTAILDSGSELTLAGGDFFLHEDNNEAADPPPENPGVALTVEQGDARYLQIGEEANPNSGFKTVLNEDGGLELAVWNQTRSIYQILRIVGAAGSETLTFTDIA